MGKSYELSEEIYTKDLEDVYVNFGLIFIIVFKVKVYLYQNSIAELDTTKNSEEKIVGIVEKH